MFIYYISVFNMELGHTAPVRTASLDNVNNPYVQVILDVMACLNSNWETVINTTKVYYYS
jgi:hypothetical protein